MYPIHPLVLWELHGRSGTVAACSISRSDGSEFAVVIRVDDSEVIHEAFRREPDAITRAQQLRREFIDAGWADTPPAVTSCG